MGNTKNTKNTENKENNLKNKCFVIMPISDQGDYPKGHFTKVYEQIIKPAIESAGYEAYRVDENKMSNTIMGKIFDAIRNCPMAVCDLSNRNPNVLYELGLRQAYNMPVVLIKDDKTERIFDVSGISTVDYNSDRLYENVLEAKEKIQEAIIATKDGEKQSLIEALQVVTNVKFSPAEFSPVDMTKDDRFEIMLNNIINDLQILKEDKYKTKGNVKDEVIRGIPSRYLEKKYFDSNIKVYYIRLKDGTTNDQIQNALDMARNMGMKILDENRTGDTLMLKFLEDNEGTSSLAMDFLRNELTDRLRRIQVLD